MPHLNLIKNFVVVAQMTGLATTSTMHWMQYRVVPNIQTWELRYRELGIVHNYLLSKLFQRVPHTVDSL